MKGALIVLDGPDGGGKTTQVALLSERLRAQGYEVVCTREPGGTGLGEKIRSMLLESTQQISAVAEAMLYTAARAQLVEEIIRPALREGHLVLAERFCYSTIAYQGYGLGLDTQIIDRLNQVATAGVEVDLTVILDISPEIAFRERLSTRALDKIEARSLGYHYKVRKGFLDLAKKHLGRTRVVDASRPVNDVHEDIFRSVRALLDLRSEEGPE